MGDEDEPAIGFDVVGTIYELPEEAVERSRRAETSLYAPAYARRVESKTFEFSAAA